ncbi:MAG TPA: hypothetical protein PLN13_13595 [Bacteroidia bacterium]|nr:hypothetical protein [Bacteroidia bacterium]HRH09610.1 hypothetical protein [Bacteroidia bacterium]
MEILTELIKLLTATFEALAAIENKPLKILASAMVLIGIGILAYLYFRKKKGNLYSWKKIPEDFERPEKEPFDKGFEVLSQITTLDITDGADGDATMSQDHIIRCTEDGANLFYLKFVVTDKQGSIDTPVIVDDKGIVIGRKKEKGVYDYTVELSHPFDVGEHETFTIKTAFKRLFPSDEIEEWIIDKFYLGNCTYKVNIIFPSDRKPKTVDFWILDKDDQGKVQKTKAKQRKYDWEKRSERHWFKYETNEIKVREQLQIIFRWKEPEEVSKYT